jgi:hypothetical protein
MAFSFFCTASSARFWVFCNSATSRNVTIVVAVLMISCQVSMLGSTTNDGAQSTTSSTQNTKNQGRDTNSFTADANRSKIDNSPVTPDGISPSCLRTSVAVIAASDLPR